MPTLTIAPGLYVWNLQLEDGAVRNVIASSLQGAIAGLVSPVLVATRGPAFTKGDGAPPVLTSLAPASTQVGQPGFTLHVHGTGLRPDSTIVWNGVPAIVTTFVSATEVTTVIASTALPAGSIPVAVRTVAGQDSNLLPFDLQPAAGTTRAPQLVAEGGHAYLDGD